MTLTLSHSQERATQKAANLSRAVSGGSVYVLREGFVFRVAQASDLVNETAPDIVAVYRKGEEVETPFAFLG